jgi:hypothetical protein
MMDSLAHWLTTVLGGCAVRYEGTACMLAEGLDCHALDQVSLVLDNAFDSTVRRVIFRLLRLDMSDAVWAEATRLARHSQIMLTTCNLPLHELPSETPREANEYDISMYMIVADI